MSLPRTRRNTSAVFGLIDQVLSALSNATMIFLGAVLLPSKDQAGSLMLTMTIVMVIVNVNRAFVGDSLLVLVPKMSEKTRNQTFRSATLISLVWSSTAAATLLGFELLAPGFDALEGWSWIAGAVPFLVLQDLGRYAAFSISRPRRAVVLDLIWVSVQLLGTAALLASSSPTKQGLLLVWGTAGSVGGIYWLISWRVNALRGSIREWLARGRNISGWFVGSAIAGQLQVQAVAFLISAFFGASGFAQYRLLHTIILSPLQNLGMALVSIAVPQGSRLVHAKDVRALRGQTQRIALGASALSVCAIGFAAVAIEPVLTAFLPDYGNTQSLAVPIAFVGAFYILQVAYGSALRGMLAAKSIFFQSCIAAFFSIAGFVLGSYFMSLSVSVWGLAIGAGIGFLSATFFYQRSLKLMTTGE